MATWAEAGPTVAADLLAGNDDVGPRAADMLRRGLAGIPESVRAAAAAGDRLRTRADAGYFTADLAHAAVVEGCAFAIAAKRNTAMWRAYASIEPDAWVDAIGMPGAALDYAVSFIATNIPANDRPGDATGNAETILEVEVWFRRRTDIEDRIREAKLGAALRHLPSGDQAVNTVWMWAALLAGNLSTLLQELTGIDEGGRAHAARLRHELLCVPARLVHHGRRLTLRLPPGDHLLPVVLTRARELRTAA